MSEHRAEQVKRILDDDLVQEAFAEIEKQFTIAWIESPAADHEGREQLYRILWSMRKFQMFFQGYIEEGQIHQHNIQALKRGQL